MKEKVVILITGQKARLELLSKKKYIITPLSEQYDISVVLSLSKTNHFTNKYKYGKNFKYKTCEIEKELGATSYYIHDIVYPELKINKDIVSMYDKRSRGHKFKLNRAKNHIRQYYTLTDSYETIKKLDPDILIRIRDDAQLTRSLDLSKLTGSNDIDNSKKIILTPSKNNHGGINDKFAIVSKAAIDTYLNNPFKFYNSYKNGSKSKFKNPEEFLSKVYSKNGISLLTSNIPIDIIGQ